MSTQPRTAIRALAKPDIPVDPGVYAISKDAEWVYVGKAGCLRDRIWMNHCGRGRVMTGSAFRRNVAEFLGVASAADIKSRRYQPTDEEIAVIRGWIEECEVAWLTRPTEAEAVALETRMKNELKPPLTKI